MKTIELQLDDRTIERVCQLAQACGLSMRAFIQKLVEQVCMTGTTEDAFLKMLANDPKILSKRMESVEINRKEHLPTQSRESQASPSKTQEQIDTALMELSALLDEGFEFVQRLKTSGNLHDPTP